MNINGYDLVLTSFFLSVCNVKLRNEVKIEPLVSASFCRNKEDIKLSMKLLLGNTELASSLDAACFNSNHTIIHCNP